MLNSQGQIHAAPSHKILIGIEAYFYFEENRTMSVIITEAPYLSERHLPTEVELEKAARLIAAILPAPSDSPNRHDASETQEADDTMAAVDRTVIMAQEVGFCFGVKRAIDLTRKALAESDNVFIVGDLIHNKYVTDRLAGEGLRKTEDFTTEPSGTTMVIRAHGMPKARIQAAQEQGLKIVDATCPIVLRTQEAAQSLEARGYQVVIIGDRHHAEVIGIVGALETPALVIGNVQELREAKARYELKRKVGVVFQTTLALELYREIVTELPLLCKETSIINTTCRPVQKRQEDALEIAKQVDLMLIVGGKASHNTQGLAALCRTVNPNTLHIQNAEELDGAQYKDCKVVGIASGLSAPEELVEAVRAKVLSRTPGSDQG